MDSKNNLDEGQESLDLLRMDSVELTQKYANKNPDQLRRLSSLQFAYSILGLVFGLACILCGAYLSFHGFANSTNWTINALNVKSELTDAGPGVVLFLVGVSLIWLTKFNIKIK